MEGKRSLIEIRLTFKSKRIDLVVKNKVGGKWKSLSIHRKASQSSTRCGLSFRDSSALAEHMSSELHKKKVLLLINTLLEVKIGNKYQITTNMPTH